MRLISCDICDKQEDFSNADDYTQVKLPKNWPMGSLKLDVCSTQCMSMLLQVMVEQQEPEERPVKKLRITEEPVDQDEDQDDTEYVGEVQQLGIPAAPAPHAFRPMTPEESEAMTGVSRRGFKA